MRFRRKETAQWRLVGATLDPGSVYRLSGEARQDWQHSISPMTTLR
jgi:alkylated DNA repair dioxygenase AlkB